MFIIQPIRCIRLICLMTGLTHLCQLLDLWQSSSDGVVGKVSDMSCRVSNSVDIKPSSYVSIQLQEHNQSTHVCLIADV